MSLYGFYFDQTRCIGCHACQVACKDRLGLDIAGPLPRRVHSYETGTFPEATIYHISVGCNHCEDPACVAQCPTGAMFMSDDGIVLHDDDRCIVCKNCMMVCPYGAPQYDPVENMIIKCDSCKPLREAGMKPVCVDACPMRALDFGRIEDLKARHGDGLVRELPCLGPAKYTKPNIYVRASDTALDKEFVRVVL